MQLGELGELFMILNYNIMEWNMSHTGLFMASKARSLSSPRRTLCWGVLPGKRSRVTVSLGSSGILGGNCYTLRIKRLGLRFSYRTR